MRVKKIEYKIENDPYKGARECGKSFMIVSCLAANRDVRFSGIKGEIECGKSHDCKLLGCQ
jgi:hypothetical protein